MDIGEHTEPRPARITTTAVKYKVQGKVTCQGFNIDKVLAKRPGYATKTASSSTSDRSAIATSVIKAMNSRKGAATSKAGQNPRSSIVTSATLRAPSAAKTSALRPAVSASAKSSSTTIKTTATATPTPAKSAPQKAATTSTRPRRKRNNRRQAANSCQAEYIAYGYTPNPNTPLGFLTDPSLINTAVTTLAPAGYTTTFNGQVGSLFADNYLGFFQLNSYNVSACTAFCEANAACKAVNLYFERDPIINPGTACPNPSAAVTVRCALWGSSVSQAQAQNIGQWRNDFMVVISGSNGYTKNTPPAAISAFTGPKALAGAINVASIDGQSVFISDSFTNGAYNPSVCTASCQSTNTANKAAAVAAGRSSYVSCNYINAFQVSQNGTNLGTYCQLYTTSAVATGYDTVYSATRNGVVYDVTYSYGYALSIADSGLTGVSTTTAQTTTTTQAATTTTTRVVTTTSTTTVAQTTTATTTTTTVRPTTTTTTTTTTRTTTTTTASPTPTNEFTIVSAFFADTDVTTQARANFLTSGSTSLNIDTTFPSTALGTTDPWSGNSGKTLVILYTWRNETRVFAAIQGTGSYTQTAGYYTTTNSPGSTLVTTNTASTTAKILAVVWGNAQYTSSSVYSGLDSVYTSNSTFSPGNTFFGSDPMRGTVKDSVVWYYGAGTTLQSMVTREYTSTQFMR